MKPGDANSSIGVVNARHESAEQLNRLENRAAKNPTVELALGSQHL